MQQPAALSDAEKSGSLQLVAVLAITAVLLCLPFLVGRYYLHIAILSMIYFYPALGLNLIYGYLGMLSLAQGAFFGIGAYVGGLAAIHLQWPLWMSLPAAGVFSALVALAVGVPALRLRNYSFVMCTLGFVFICESISKNWVSVTRGDMGLSGIPRPFLGFTPGSLQISSLTDYYYLTLALALIALFVFWLIVRSPAGRAMRAISEEEVLAESQGIHAGHYALVGFALSALFGGIGGAIYASYMTIVSPLTFQLYYTLLFLVIVFAGGAGTISGVALGTFIFVALPEALRLAADWRQLIYGLTFLALVFLLPKGIGPALAQGVRWLVRASRRKREGQS